MKKPDVLEPWRDIAARGNQPYKAYSLSAEPLSYLEIRVKFPDPAECPNYALLRNVRMEWRMGTGLTLLFPGLMQVIIKGENLQELGRAFLKHRVEWIQEYNEIDWPEKPPIGKEAFIKSIRIKTPHDDSDAAPPMNKRH
jgi:hypothetical protein